ncbi:hypothetical protein B0T10DRAFT_549622 [Thelonectria olida]|uniref:Uncharacterized protein n=1 Tax=Thelonectria olida TaxID=1576542 RepID=A0A9P8W4K7_9HYPO|nr:hypothetical protein B0T10DRAFT_549622 [Thelonectria olida]
MIPRAVPALLLCMPASVAAIFEARNDTSFWEEFTNNFATDLAPIISLFGEQVTKQFLSESTSILDTIIFAVGPLGILTAIVSCIRVCGGSFLRSLVGRAREPHGMPEIEVCSSTSENVCELWSNGGICRVFGRPKLLEFIYRAPTDPSEYYARYVTGGGSVGVEKIVPATCGIGLTSQVFGEMQPERLLQGNKKKSSQSKSSWEWKEISANQTLWLPLSMLWSQFFQRTRADDQGKPGTSAKATLQVTSETTDIELGDLSHLTREEGLVISQGLEQIHFKVQGQGDHGREQIHDASTHQVNTLDPTRRANFAPFPNLALNIGVQKASTSALYLWLAAIFGVLLQTSFFSYAVWATWYHPAFYQGQDVSNTLLFFTFTMAGTAAVVIGMALSSLLIDRNSEERRFIVSSPGRTDHHIFWLQPGGQRIGDQQFDAFAHNEKKMEYVTSWKIDGAEPVPRILVWLAVGLSFLGWTFQFIGLRGQHATISLYQLCCTVIMSTIRALIRSFRSTPINRLHHLKNNVEGHELDWQALCFTNNDGDQKFDDSQSSAANKMCWAIDGSRLNHSSGTHYASPESPPHWKIALDDNSMIGLFFGDYDQRTAFVEMARNISWRTETKNFNHWRDSCRSFDDKADSISSMQKVIYGDEEGKWDFPNLNAKSMRIRWRLASLINDLPYQTWESEIQSTALRLKKVFQGAAKLFAKHGILADNGPRFLGAIVWSTTCQLWGAESDCNQSEEASISFQVLRNNDTGSWTIDEYQLEAVLGLWSWTFDRWYLDNGLRQINHKEIAVGHEKMEAVSLGLKHWGIQVTTDPFQRGRLSNLCIPTMARYRSSKQFPSRPQSDTSQPSAIVSVDATSSLLQLMAQDIFTIFIERVALLLHEQLVETAAEKRKLTAEQQVVLVEESVELLTSGGLATRSEAIMSIIPGLFSDGVFSGAGDIQRPLISRATFLKRQGKFREGEQILEEFANTESPDIQTRTLKSLCEIYRSEFRLMIQQHSIFTWHDCRIRSYDMIQKIKSRVQRDEDEPFINVYRDVITWLLLDVLPIGGVHAASMLDLIPVLQDVPRNHGTPQGLDETTVNALNLDHIKSWREAHAVALTLDERYNLAESSIPARKQLLRWAIEWDCTGLVEDLWNAEPKYRFGEGAFSGGSDELFWAVNCRTTESDMMNTIFFLLDVVETRKERPLRLGAQLDEQWWTTSQQKAHMKKRYAQFGSVLDAASADPEGFEIVRTLVDGDDIRTHDWRGPVVAAMEHGSLETVEYLVPKLFGEVGPCFPKPFVRRHSDRYDGPFLAAAKWGVKSYFKRLLSDGEKLSRRDARMMHDQLPKASKLAKRPLSIEEARRAEEVLHSDMEGVLGLLELFEERLEQYDRGSESSDEDSL